MSGHGAVLSVVLWFTGVIRLLSPTRMTYVGSLCVPQGVKPLLRLSCSELLRRRLHHAKWLPQQVPREHHPFCGPELGSPFPSRRESLFSDE